MLSDEKKEQPAKGAANDQTGNLERAVPAAPPAGTSLDKVLLANSPDAADRKSSVEAGRSLLPQSPASEDPLKNRPAPLDLERTRERTRQRLASLLLGAYASTNIAILVVTGIGYFYTPKNDQTYNLLTLLITSQTTLVGTALGFYFGERKSDKTSD